MCARPVARIEHAPHYHADSFESELLMHNNLCRIQDGTSCDECSRAQAPDVDWLGFKAHAVTSTEAFLIPRNCSVMRLIRL